MSAGQTRRALVKERLTAAAEEIFALFERTIAEYEEELRRCKQELLLNPSGPGLDLGLDPGLDNALDPGQGLHPGLNLRLSLSLDQALHPGLEAGQDQALTLETPHPVGIKEEPEESVKHEDEPMQCNKLPVAVPESRTVGVKTEEFSLLQLHSEEERPGENISAEPHPETEEDTDHSSDNDEGLDPLRASRMETEADGDKHNQDQLLVAVPESRAVSVKTEEFSLLHSEEERPRENISAEPHLETEEDEDHSSDNDEGLDPLRASRMETEAGGDEHNRDQISFKKDEGCDATDCVPHSEGESSHETSNSEELNITFDQQQKQAPMSTVSLDSCSSLVQNFIDATSDHCTVAFSTNTATTVFSLPVTPKGSKYSKKQYCLFCQKPFSKLSRHLQSVHRDERDVALAFSYKKGSKKRKEMLLTLQKKGNFSHNASVAISGVGELIVCRRPCSSKPSSAYLYCKFCQGLYAREHLWRHVKNCHKEAVRGEFGVRRKHIGQRFPKPAAVKAALWKIVCSMNDDDVSATVRNEANILQLGDTLYNSRKPFERRNRHICQTMQDLARLLIEVRATTPLKSVEDLVTPANIPHIIKAVRSVAGFGEGSNSYAVPSLALQLGQSLIKMAGIIHGNALAENLKDIAESAKTFEILYQNKWKESVSAVAFGTLEQSKGKKPLLLPFTHDVKTLHKFLSVERAKCMKELEEEPNKKSFSNLAKVTLTQVLLFNRRRECDVSEMELLSYTSRNLTELTPARVASLGKFEKRLAAHFERVEIRGTRFRKVPVLLTPEMTAAIDLLTEKRGECQVPKESVYVFARPEALSFFRGAECFRDFAKLCGAQHPKALTSTRLREQVATLSTLLSLKENNMDQLAAFVGCDVRGEFCRLPESALQLAKVCKLLIVMENGLLPDLSGKRLDDIVINPEDEVDIDDGGEGLGTDPQTEDSADGAGFPESDQISERRVSKRGKKWRQWTETEVKAVERHMMEFIAWRKVPGKQSCDSCLRSEPRALKDREWVDIKNYIHNRIMALKRKKKK